MMSLTEWIHRIGPHNHALTAVIDSEKSYSYGELKESIKQLATALDGFQLPRGSVVYILSHNCVQAIVGFWAALWAGYLPNFVNTRWTMQEAYLSLQDCEAHILLVDGSHEDMGIQLFQDLPSLKQLIFIDGDGHDIDNSYQLEQLLDSDVSLKDQSGIHNDDAFINYTGGTTGRGKGVVHTHLNLIKGLNVCFAEGFYVYGCTFGLVIPLFHISGIMSMAAMLRSFGQLVVIPAFEPTSILKLIEEHEISSMMLVPTMCRMLISEPGFDPEKLQSLRSILYGGSPIDRALLDKLATSLPFTELFQVYGQTECAPVTFLHPQNHSIEADQETLRSTGRPGYGISIKIIDEKGNTMPEGETGEICFSGETALMSHYFNQPGLTKKTLIDGCCHSGDVGYLKNGYLYVLDRLKDMIITGGENVYSAEVENALSSHDLVKQCAVIGVEDDKWGERVHAFLVLNREHNDITTLLQAHCRELIAGYKIPRSFTIIENLPLTSVGKINKVELKKMANQSADED